MKKHVSYTDARQSNIFLLHSSYDTSLHQNYYLQLTALLDNTTVTCVMAHIGDSKTGSVTGSDTVYYILHFIKFAIAIL